MQSPGVSFQARGPGRELGSLVGTWDSPAGAAEPEAGDKERGCRLFGGQRLPWEAGFLSPLSDGGAGRVFRVPVSEVGVIRNT